MESGFVSPAAFPHHLVTTLILLGIHPTPSSPHWERSPFPQQGMWSGQVTRVALYGSALTFSLPAPLNIATSNYFDIMREVTWRVRRMDSGLHKSFWRDMLEADRITPEALSEVF